MQRSYHPLRMFFRAAFAVALMGALLASAALAAESHVLRSNGVQVTVPEDWTRVEPADDGAVDDPRTLLVVGTKGVRAIETTCQVSSYRVPADGAVVVVIGWKRPSTGVTLLPLAAIRLKRDTFECFDDRGAVGQVTRNGRDYQVNVMVGDRADAKVVHDALAVARSFAVASRP
jgi:hypothetical protein